VIPLDHTHLHIAAATHPGLRGKANEDRYSVSAYRFNSDDHPPSVLALLADGIGGHHAGEVAAQLAVENINKYVAESLSNQPSQVLKQALTYSNQIILDHSKEDPMLAGMGTTCVCAWVIGNQLFATSVGDSRLYLQRGARLVCLTTDHTWIQEALAQGSLMPDQVKGHPNAHIIRRFLGSKNAIIPDMRLRLNPFESDTQAEANQGLHLLPGDRLLLCSDGLTDLVQDGEILDILRTRKLESSSAELIDLANQRGGHDNITVVAMEVPQLADVTQPSRLSPSAEIVPAQKIRRSPVSWLMVGLLLVAILLMVLLLIYLFYFK
jgi:serine/threonine protein phosphatase PrpC